MDNVVLVTFEDEGKAYEEFNRLKDNEATADFTILEMAVVKNVDGAIMVPDGYQDGLRRDRQHRFRRGHRRCRRLARAAQSACFWAPASPCGRYGHGRQGHR